MCTCDIIPFKLQSSPKCLHDISNPNIYIPLTHIPQIVGRLYPIQNCTLPNSVPEGHKETLSNYNHPPSVGIIYPIATYKFHSHIFPKLLAGYIQYTIVHYPTLCPKGTKKPFQFTIILQVLPWYIQSQHIYSTHTYSPYLIEMFYFRIIHYPIYKTHP